MIRKNSSSSQCAPLRSSRGRRAESLLLLSLSFPLVQLAKISLFFFAQSRVFVRLFLFVVAGKDLQKEKRNDFLACSGEIIFFSTSEFLAHDGVFFQK